LHVHKHEAPAQQNGRAGASVPLGFLEGIFEPKAAH
jgi:hypothetical protein